MTDSQELPEICRMLSERVVELEAEIKRLRGELGWYVGRSAESLMYDGGKRAARALSGGFDDDRI